MKFDYTSDLHIDIHFKNIENMKLYKSFFDIYFQTKKSDKLIIAGDLGHNISQNLKFLKFLKNEYGYKDIFTVEGNHSYYLTNKEERKQFKNGIEKADYSKKLYQDNDIKILNGNTYSIIEKEQEIIIGGSDSWYDAGYLKLLDENLYSEKSMLEMWKRTMPDFKFMNIEDFLELSNIEKAKFKNLENKCDIIVSHVKPLVSKSNFYGVYKNSPTNAFFGFNFEKEIIQDKKLKIWIYGHIHTIENFEYNGKKMLCNPLGYKNEIFNKKIESFSI